MKKILLGWFATVLIITIFYIIGIIPLHFIYGDAPSFDVLSIIGISTFGFAITLALSLIIISLWAIGDWIVVSFFDKVS